MVRTQIQLSEEQSARLRALAAKRSVSMSELVRQAVEAMLSSSRQCDADEARHRAIAAAGRFSSGLGDLAERHDDYLAEAFE